MASLSPRGDKFLAQVRIKKGGGLIFSESKVFDTRAQATSWGDRLEAKVKAEGPAKHASSKTTVGELLHPCAAPYKSDLPPCLSELGGEKGHVH